MSGFRRNLVHSRRGMLVVFAAATLASAVLFGMLIARTGVHAAENRALDTAARVRQGDLEHAVWSVVDPATLQSGLSAENSDLLDEAIPTAFGSRSSVVSARIVTATGLQSWAWGTEAPADVSNDIGAGPRARVEGAREDGIVRVTYVLPLRPMLSSETSVVLIATVTDAEVAAAASGLLGWLMVALAGGLAVLWLAALLLTKWMLERSWGETENQRRVAMIDPLTGLANRSALTERGNAAIANAHRTNGHVGLVVVDLNRFKAVNDTGGHALGDRVLIEVARRLLDVTRRGELAVRVGGDEFAVLIPAVQRRDELEALASRLRSVLEIPVRFNAADDVRVTASVGVACSPTEGESMAELFKSADAVMYAEKFRLRTPLNASIERAKQERVAQADHGAEADPTVQPARTELV